jgi:cytidylate kinase
LKKADDAVEIDTTSLTIQDVVEKIMVLVHERIG